MKKIAITMLLFMGFLSIQAAHKEKARYEKKIYVEHGDTLPYRILYPKNFDPKREYPVILFLHGAGERGVDNEKQLKLGGNLFLQPEVREDYPAIVVFPQCPNTTMWTAREKRREDKKWLFSFPTEQPTAPTQLVANLMKKITAEPYVEQDRVYLMGISMGGIGTLEFLHRWPNQYAAAVVICGGNNPDYASNYKHVPIWFFHGEADDVVPSHYSKSVYDAVKDGHRATRYSSYPNTNHNSWDKALAEPNLLKWMFKKKR